MHAVIYLTTLHIKHTQLCHFSLILLAYLMTQPILDNSSKMMLPNI